LTLPLLTRPKPRVGERAHPIHAALKKCDLVLRHLKDKPNFLLAFNELKYLLVGELLLALAAAKHPE
jgi:hypothetical protein